MQAATPVAFRGFVSGRPKVRSGGSSRLVVDGTVTEAEAVRIAAGRVITRADRGRGRVYRVAFGARSRVATRILKMEAAAGPPRDGGEGLPGGAGARAGFSRAEAPALGIAAVGGADAVVGAGVAVGVSVLVGAISREAAPVTTVARGAIGEGGPETRSTASARGLLATPPPGLVT